MADQRRGRHDHGRFRLKRLLHLQASPRGARSRSSDVGVHFLARLCGGKDAPHVETLDLWSAELPAFDGSVIEGRYRLLMGDPVEPQQAAAWAAIERVAAHFLSFDAWLITTPMWNFGIPYRLKHYIDLLTHPGMTFRNDAIGNVEGLAAGRIAIILSASAMDIRPDTPLGRLDFQVAYLETWLDFIGVGERHVIRTAPTFGPPDLVDTAMSEGRAAAEALADRLRQEWAQLAAPAAV